MSGRTIDFYGIVHLNQALVEHLDHYLQEKETRLANQILQSLSPHEIDPKRPVIVPSNNLKLAEVIEGFTKKIRLLNRNQYSAVESDAIIRELNSTFWEFTEVLEGCVVELFQQIKQVSVHEWYRSLAPVVQDIKEILLHYIEDLKWIIHRIEKPIHEFQRKMQPSSKGIKHWFNRLQGQELDPAILEHLTQSEELLKTEYENFQYRYHEYQRINIKVEESLKKMERYPILAILDVEDQNLYVDVFRLLKLLEFNPQPRGILAEETARSLKNLYSIQGVVKIFRIYFQGLKEAFFRSSLELKALGIPSEEFDTGRAHLLGKVKDYEKELRSLIGTMGRYREFALQTDSNPYVRSRLGFKEWPLAPEPPKARALLQFIYLAEELKTWYESFIEALSKDTISQEHMESLAHQEIERLLHEMSQPLISQSMMRSRADRLLFYIKDCNEVSSPHFDTIHYIGNVISRAMRADWKYHVLHDFPLFHELYRIHRGLERASDDPAHAFRMERFYELFEQIESWVQKGDVYSHVHEIEIDINDMKTYLQDFLAAIQRASKDRSSDPFLDETIQRFWQQLMEYRYIFGQFFLNITSKNLDGQQLRNQFLFVDQYFETIENLINELKLSWKGDR